MISCPHCEGNHRDSERVEICGIRLQRRLERAERQEADRARRWKNALEQTPWDYIHWRRRMGDSWDKIVAALNRDYPPPAPGRRYDLTLVIQLCGMDLNWGSYDTIPVYRVGGVR